jgi:D-alanyl-D-alanine dipeptidase
MAQGYTVAGARRVSSCHLPFASNLMRCEDIATHPDFRHLSTIDDIAMDLRYAGVNNFVGRDLYGSVDCAWLHRLAAEALQRAVTLLARKAPGHRLLVLDALRPHRVQIQLWDYLEGTDLRQYVADPARGSIHSFGMAMDATLVDAQGRELDMGTGFDEMTDLSHPRLEAKHLASGELTPAQHRNRELLRHVLRESGFRGLDNEWWHFEMPDREHVRQHFMRVD